MHIGVAKNKLQNIWRSFAGLYSNFSNGIWYQTIVNFELQLRLGSLVDQVRIFPQLEEIQLRRMEKLKDIWPHEDEDGRLKDQLRNDNFSSLQRQLIETKEAIERQRKLFKKIQYGSNKSKSKEPPAKNKKCHHIFK
ncbi:hypothetical protein S83_062589 [Arachis hypogaea]